MFLFSGKTLTRTFEPGSPTAREYFGHFGGKIVVKAGLTHPGPTAAQAPHVSVTCSFISNARGGTDCGGGASHAEIVKHFPELASLVKFHLWGVGAGPMHYVENGVYWWKLAQGFTQPSKWDRNPPDPAAAFARTVGWGLIEEGDDNPLDWTLESLGLAEPPDDGKWELVPCGDGPVWINEHGTVWRNHAIRAAEERLRQLLAQRSDALQEALLAVLGSNDIDATWDPRPVKPKK